MDRVIWVCEIRERKDSVHHPERSYKFFASSDSALRFAEGFFRGRKEAYKLEGFSDAEGVPSLYYFKGDGVGSAVSVSNFSESALEFGASVFCIYDPDRGDFVEDTFFKVRADAEESAQEYGGEVVEVPILP